MNAHATNYAALGLDYGHGRNAFTGCTPRSSKPESHTAPAKRGPKPSKMQQSIDALSTFEERRAAREKRILKDNSAVNFTISATPQADRDRTAKIMGRPNGARTQ